MAASVPTPEDDIPPEPELEPGWEGEKLNPFEEGDLQTQIDAPPSLSDKKSLFGSLLGLVLLVGFHAFQLSQFIAHDTAPPAWDQSIQLDTALDIHQALDDGNLSSIKYMKPKPGMPPFPPLYHLSIQHALDEKDPAKSALWTNLGYMALLCLSLWGLARLFAGNWAGLAAAAMFSCAPECQWLMREVLTDLPLTALVAAAYWAYFSSNRLSSKIPAALLGVLFGAAMMTKWSAFSYFFPVAYAAAKAARQNKSSRIGLLLAFAGALAVAAPWYIAQWQVVLPRLVQASGDKAVPVWQGLAIISYLAQMASGFELPFFVLGLAGLASGKARRAEREQWLLPLIVVVAYVFWTIVPNRQLRYLLPGLTPLAVLAVSSFPRQVVAGIAAFQVFSALNYGFGWIPKISIPLGVTVSVFRNQPPKAENWRLDEAIAAAMRQRDKSTPFGNMTLVANHPHLNGPTMRWELNRRGIDEIKMRGVNSRICEFSEFLLMKTGSLGPPTVVNQLPQVQNLIMDGKSWFHRGWVAAGEWPLPDRTVLMLFKRAKLRRMPIEEEGAFFQYFKERNFEARELDVNFGGFSASRGVYPNAVITAPWIGIRGLDVRGVRVVIEDLALIPVNTDKEAVGKTRNKLLDFRFLRAKRLRLISARVDETSLANFIMARVKGMTDVTVKMSGGRVSAQGRWRGHSVKAAVSLGLGKDGKSLRVAAEEANFAGIRLPLGLLGPFKTFSQPLTPNPELPFYVDVAGLRLDKGELRIGKSK